MTSCPSSMRVPHGLAQGHASSADFSLPTQKQTRKPAQYARPCCLKCKDVGKGSCKRNSCLDNSSVYEILPNQTNSVLVSITEVILYIPSSTAALCCCLLLGYFSPVVAAFQCQLQKFSHYMDSHVHTPDLKCALGPFWTTGAL